MEGSYLFLAAAVIPYVLFTLFWQWKTQGDYFLFLKWQAADLHLSNLWYYLRTSFFRECLWVVVAVGWVAWRKSVSLVLKLQVLFSLLWFLAAALDASSAENHYMEFFLISIFALGEGAKSLAGRPVWKGSMVLYSLLALGLVLEATAAPPRLPSKEEMDQKSKALSLYQKQGEYLALDSDIPYLAGRRIWFQFQDMVPFYRNGLWDPAPLEKEIQAKRFLSIEVYDLPFQPFVPDPVMRSIEMNYHVGTRAFGRLWFVPTDPPASRKSNK